MPLLKRAGKPALNYVQDDYTDTWKNAGTILLQHGYGRSSKFWYRWIPYLSRYYRIVRLDLRGFGESPVDFDPHTDLTLDAHIEDITALLDHLELDSVHYAGESFGGILGMVLTATQPKRIRTLTLVSSPVHLTEKHLSNTAFGYPSRVEYLRAKGSKQWAVDVNALNRFPAGTDAGLLEWYASEMGKTHVEILVEQYLLQSKASARDLLPRIEAPVLGLYPTSGVVTSSDQEVLLKAGIRNLSLVHLPTSNHSIAMLHAATCARHMLHFASQHDGLACHEA